MALMFAGRFTRPDILLPVSVHATRNSNLTQADMKRALRTLKFVAKKPDTGITFDGNKPLVPAIYADASLAIYHDGYGQAGMVLTLGSGAIHCKTNKIKTVTRSSSESELVALEDACTYAVWWKKLIIDLKVISHKDSIIMYQDNLSTIIIATHGGNSKRTKHFTVEEAYIREQVSKKTIKLKYRPTDSMRANFLTKALSSNKLQRHLEGLHVYQLGVNALPRYAVLSDTYPSLVQVPGIVCASVPNSIFLGE